MAWTYSGNPAASDLDAVRFWIQDTDVDDPLLQDAEINYLLALEGNVVLEAASSACDAVAASFSRKATSKSVGDLSLSFADRASEYRMLAVALKGQAAKTNPPTPWANQDAMKSTADRDVTLYTTDFYLGITDYKPSSIDGYGDGY